VGVQAQSGAWNELATALDFGDRKAVVEASLMMPDSYPFTMIFRLLGDEGHAEYQYGGGQSDPQAAARLHRLVLYRNGEQPRIPPCDEIDPYLAEIRYFVDCLDKGQTPAIATLAEARTVLGIALAARQSLETCRVVDIEQS
jgi:predicted dehydrogenase